MELKTKHKRLFSLILAIIFVLEPFSSSVALAMEGGVLNEELVHSEASNKKDSTTFIAPGQDELGNKTNEVTLESNLDDTSLSLADVANEVTEIPTVEEIIESIPAEENITPDLEIEKNSIEEENPIENSLVDPVSESTKELVVTDKAEVLVEETVADPELTSSQPTEIPMFRTMATTMAVQPMATTAQLLATGTDKGALVSITSDNIGNDGYPSIYLDTNRTTDTFMLDLAISFDNAIKAGDYFDIKIPAVLRPDSILTGGLVDITDSQGNILAQAQYNATTNTIRYVFSDLVDRYEDITATLRQPFNINPANTTNGYYSFTVAGKTFRDYYYISNSYDYAAASYAANLKSVIAEVDRDAGTFTQYIHLNPNDWDNVHYSKLYLTKSTLSPGNSAIIDDKTSVELYRTSTPSSINLYDPTNLTPVTGIMTRTNGTNSIILNFGNYLSGSYADNNQYIVKVTGKLDESGNPIGITTNLQSKYYNSANEYNYSATVNTYYSNPLGSSSFTGTAIYMPIDFTINKYDEINNPLTGSGFQIIGKDGTDSVIYDETIETDGVSFDFKGLPLGNYQIFETKVPDGYVTPPSYWEFTVTIDDTGKTIITTPDFPMEISTDDSSQLVGDYPSPYASLYTDLVRNPYYYKNLIRDTSSISKRIISKVATNTYEVEVILGIEPNKTVSGGMLREKAAQEFNIELGEDGGFAREDFSLTASDGSFLYIEQPGMASGVYGGEPFATNKVLSGASISYDSATDAITVKNINYTAGDQGAWVKLTYKISFDEAKLETLDDKTFYRISANGTGETRVQVNGYLYNIVDPAIRPIVKNTQADPTVDVINVKEPATMEMTKVGEQRVYKLDENGQRLKDSEGKDIFTYESKPLAGAEFELYAANTNDPNAAKSTYRRFITPETGQIYFDDIRRSFQYTDIDGKQAEVNNYYWLKELSAPTGYAPIVDLIGPFTVDYDGKLTYLGNQTSVADVDSDPNINDYQITNERLQHKGELDIFKYEQGQEPKVPIQGAEFTLYWVGEEETTPYSDWQDLWNSTTDPVTKVTDQDGKAQFVNLKEGYYRLEETKPSDGYIQSVQIWLVKVDSEGFTSITDITGKDVAQAEDSAASIDNHMMRSLSTSYTMSLINENMISMQATMAATATSSQMIDNTHYPYLYSAPDKTYNYPEPPIKNNTGFEESYQNSENTSGLYTFDGTFEGQRLENVAGINKYAVPTGRPGEYEVHVRVSGNRIDSNTGVVLVYDNSNSMKDNNRLTEANKAITSFVNSLVSTEDASTKVAMVTYGSSIFDNHGVYTFTNDPTEITKKLPTSVPEDRGIPTQGGTYTQGALDKAQSLFENTNFDNKIIITISDGVPTFSNIISYIDTDGDYKIADPTQKTGTGNRFIQPYTSNSAYRNYWVEDRTKAYDPTAAYASATTNKYYFDQTNKTIKSSEHTATRTVPGYYPFNYVYPNYGGYSRVTYQPTGTSYYYNGYYYYRDTYGYYSRGAYTTTENYTSYALPNNGYGYKLITNHGFATIDEGRQIQADGIGMYTIGIQIDKGSYTYNGYTYDDATRDQALEVMFGISSSKDTYFDAQNLDYLDLYLSQILTELEEKNPPTVNNGILTDPMGEMVILDRGTEENPQTFVIRDVGSKPIPSETLDAISAATTEESITLNNLNLSRDQEIEMVYKVHLNTEHPDYVAGKMYETNGPTTLQPNGDYEKTWNLPIPKISGPDTSMMLTKIWQGADGKVPDTEGYASVKVQLQRKLVGQDDTNYVNVGEEREVAHSDWNTTFENLIPFDSKGNVYEYRILEVNPDGKYSILYEGNGYSRSIINRERQTQDIYNTPNKITFTKKDSVSGDVMKDVRFSLNRDGSVYERYGDVFTNANGQIIFEKLPPGKYELMEEVPSGYQPVINPIRTFFVGADGRIRIDDVETTEDTIENTPIQVPVTLKKVDGNDNTITLAGAVFELYESDQETLIKTVESDDQGIIDLGILRYGQYYLKEITPPSDEYQPIPGFQNLMVEADRIKFNGNVKNPKAEDYTPHEVANYKEKTTEIAVKKITTNSDGTIDTLSGASFKITNSDGSDIDPQPGTYTNYKEGDETTQAESYGMFTQLKAGTYKIVESTSPLGYVRYEGYYTFEVEKTTDEITGETDNNIIWIKKYDPVIQDGSPVLDNDGNLTYNETTIYEKDSIFETNDVIKVIGSDGESEANAIGIQINNKPNELSIRKTDAETKEVMAGVKFELLYEVDKDLYEYTGINENGDDVYLRWAKENSLVNPPDPNDDSKVTRTTDENGLITFDRLPQRYSQMTEIKYYLREIETLDGYNPIENVIGPYTVTDQGVLDPDGNLMPTASMPIDIVNYQKADLQLKKIDGDDSTGLAGAEFNIYMATKKEDGSYNPKNMSEIVKEKTTVGGIEQEIDLKITTDENGLASFTDIADGLYWIKERKAPSGYALVLDYIGPYLVEDGKIYKVDLDSAGKITTEPNAEGQTVEKRTELTKVDTIYQVEVKNYQALYPSTGGIGTILFSLTGGALMGGAILFRKKKKEEEEEDRE